MKLQKLLVLALALLLCLSLFSCAKKEPQTKTEEEDKTEEKLDPIFDTYDHSEEVELLDNTETWLGLSDSGPLKDKDGYQINIIKNKKDLDPYRPYIFSLSAEDEERMLSDKDGRIVLIELVAEDEYTQYSTDSIQSFAGTMTVAISRHEAEEPTDAHTFFLLYFPGEMYRGEAVEVLLS